MLNIFSYFLSATAFSVKRALLHLNCTQGPQHYKKSQQQIYKIQVFSCLLLYSVYYPLIVLLQLLEPDTVLIFLSQFIISISPKVRNNTSGNTTCYSGISQEICISTL